jgi:hypothetical protein
MKIVDESFHFIPLSHFFSIYSETSMSQEQFAKQRLVYSILKFLDREIQTEVGNAERRESIEGRLIIYRNIMK